MTCNIAAQRFMFILAFLVVLTFGSCKKNNSEFTIPKNNDSTKVDAPTPVKGKEYTLLPDADGRLVIDGAKVPYKGGDVLNLKGKFSAIYISKLNGSVSSPIIIRNVPGSVTTIGNPNWDGGSWAEGISLVTCHYIMIGGDKSASDFIIDGSVKGNRGSYFNLVISKGSDNIEVRNLTIRNGGTGIWAKTDPVKSDPSTWYPNSTMQNLSIHGVVISGTDNEAMYIGHTATYWNLDVNTNNSYYGDPSGFTPGNQYVQPIKWNNVKIFNNKVSNGGADGIQTAAINNLEVYNNTVTNWGIKHNSSHNGGILIGGRTTNTYVHDNYVHDGWGELLQFFGSGENGAKHVFHNNLFVNNSVGGNDGVNLRGTDNPAVTFTNNTIAQTGGVSLRLNGEKGMKAAIIVNDNAFIQPRMSGGSLAANAYVYTENGAQALEGAGDKANARIATVDAAKVDVANFFLPLGDSPLGVTGYRK
ncbi:Right handed beta helix region [Chitinophaga terrae (ex Kim and Jung 2007)]|uniref:Right handed beta helix region n=1 Tax=Chitinophaga terrae (ex Kim and Jung 2007) TaxID=408074 RepID=A0A1H4CCS5_9BACT|nr:right-handed parallel beta-helix repeat-containing protein [Chitinophaga terrae (ex Kim and Jung 2007)]MDQ0109395.1 hypothetical protein [Chitinophaga terrae (ex Kim and Jung 2007)]SEA58197.1 Right handed beta helix region [Chitinophaga terrae (ex Kim and Jung 2007)]